MARTARVVGWTNVSTQKKTSIAADPAVTHKRNAEAPISESMPSINPLHRRPGRHTDPIVKYGAYAATMPARPLPAPHQS